MASIINVLISSFPGLGLPSTTCLPLPASSTVSDLVALLSEQLPSPISGLTVTTTSNKALNPSSTTRLGSLLSSPRDAFLPLRLSACLRGGKGGFGSQLRAAGGRMSSRKKRSQGDSNGSSRNLDGRRLRTVTEAKALAEYLALKPEMDKKEKDERRKRWEQVVEMTERKQEEMRSGGKARLDGKWVESKEEAAEKTREAVLASLSAGDIKDALQLRESDRSATASEASDSSDSAPGAENSRSKSGGGEAPTRSFFGWDEDDDMSDETDDGEADPRVVESAMSLADKGKAKAS